jgi:SEA/GATOR complex protein SEA4/MIOS
MKRYGDIEALLITGLNPLALDVIQAYLDNTGDVQTAAILASCVSPARWKPTERSKPFDNHSGRWIEAYQDLLDSWRLFHHRCQFDMLRGEIKLAAIHDGEVTPFEWVPRQLEVRCNYCNKIINSSQPMESGPYGVNGRVKVSYLLTAPIVHCLTMSLQADFCPSCQRKLPRCVICLMTIGVPDEEARHIELADAISFRGEWT